MNSIERVLKAHGEELRKRCLEEVKDCKLIKDVQLALSDGLYGVAVTYILVDGTEIEGKEMDIDTLAEWYPDCEVGY